MPGMLSMEDDTVNNVAFRPCHTKPLTLWCDVLTMGEMLIPSIIAFQQVSASIMSNKILTLPSCRTRGIAMARDSMSYIVHIIL